MFLTTHSRFVVMRHLALLLVSDILRLVHDRHVARFGRHFLSWQNFAKDDSAFLWNHAANQRETVFIDVFVRSIAQRLAMQTCRLAEPIAIDARGCTTHSTGR